MGARKTERNEQYEYVVAAKPSNTQKHSVFEHTHTHTQKLPTISVKQKPCERKEAKKSTENYSYFASPGKIHRGREVRWQKKKNIEKGKFVCIVDV